MGFVGAVTGAVVCGWVGGVIGTKMDEDAKKNTQAEGSAIIFDKGPILGRLAGGILGGIVGGNVF